ncbi:uncharacterized protein PV09_05941 [Verruconis gallopava]|uniref:Uncharacterized protein n=1 Tax=Verruconis gallopava TaxID=253628 RepID=A0A0D1XKN4_9PEZI|nr:uncharacterized protein PV09_05941 [Verruconis gallopava]KIW02891.1 hypothetical protein PV09_05941 [Verruconis gallopava]
MSRPDKTQEQLRAAIEMASQGGARAPLESPRSPRSGAPQHPIKSMQGPFEESIEEAANPPDTSVQDSFNQLDARKRRQRLLDTDSTNGTYNEQWRSQSSTARFHPLTKIISQVAFGVHLLHQQLAKSDEEVVRILQKHVDDVDNFVQRTEEDFDLAINDIRERINYLKLPLEHAGVFDVMLDDKTFRKQILDGNEKIEKVVDKTSMLVKDLQVDVQKGMEATIEMGKYLDDISDDWPQNDRGSIQIFQTMQANVEGWVQCMSTLQMKGNGLSVAVVQLGSILNEMAKRAASASRREQRRAERAANGGSSRSMSSSQHRYSHSSSRRHERRVSHKPLPKDPDLIAKAVEATVPGAKLPHRQSSRRERRYDAPREAPMVPKSSANSIKSSKSAKSGKSAKSSKQSKKPTPIRTDKMPTPKKVETAKSESKKSKITELASVFRFHGSAAPSAAPSPLASPTLPPPSFPHSSTVSPLASPRSSSAPPHTEKIARKPVPPPAPVEMDANSTAVYELDNDPQATLIEARSRLREQQSQEALSSRLLQTPNAEENDKGRTSTSPSMGEATDSAYASSPETEIQRPTTSPTPRPPGIGSLGIFPSSSMTSLPSMVNVEQDRLSDKESVTALPAVINPINRPTYANSTAPKEPSRLRHGSVPNVLPNLKKKTSLSALKKLFSRKTENIEPSPRTRTENHEGRETPSISAKEPILESLIELPG